MYLIVQRLRVWKEDGRWVTLPMEDFRMVEASEQSLGWGCAELPGTVYTATVGKLRIDVSVQTVYTVDGMERVEQEMLFWGSSTSYDTKPQPNAVFTSVAMVQSKRLAHLGSQAEQDEIGGLGLSVAPVWPGEEAPKELASAAGLGSGGGDDMGNSWASQRTEPGWGPSIELGGGGGESFDPQETPVFPEYFVADLYVDGLFIARTALYPQEGGQ